jgi:hypothetical protein
MRLYKFFEKASSRVALSTDADGGNLPGEAKDWLRQSELDVERGGPERIGFPNSQILDAIEKLGYFIPGKDD